MDTQQVNKAAIDHLSGWLVSMLLVGVAQAASDEFPQRRDGDIGFAGVHRLAIKTLKLGDMGTERADRISQDGFSTNAPGLQGLGKEKCR